MAKQVDKYWTAASHGSKHQDIALRDLLHNDFGLPQDKVELCTLLTNFKKKKIIKLGKKDWERLCPTNGVTDINELDLTPLAIIFRSIEHIVPNFSDHMRKVKQEYEPFVKQACSNRNDLAHPRKDQMTKNKFIEIMKKITSTLLGMNYSQMKIFEYWKTCPIYDENLKQELHSMIDKLFQGKSTQ